MKKMFIMIMAMIMCILPCSMVFASGNGLQGWYNQISAVSTVPDMPSGSKDVVENVLGALQAAGMIVAVFILIFFGFKYLTAGAGEKAKTKEMLVPFLIGAAVVALAPNIAAWVWELT